MEATKIAWTATVLADGTVAPGYTFNPWMGCTKVSPGCAHCYAETLTKNRMGLSVWGPTGRRQVTAAANWKKPLQWNREAECSGIRKRVFSASLADLFEDHPIAIATLPRFWELIRTTPWLDWQLLTKRPERIVANLPDYWDTIKDHVWMGTSVENADYAWRADYLRSLDCAVRFVSYEPALGPLAGFLDLTGIDWLIIGGESGSHISKHPERQMKLQWARDMIAACREAGVKPFFKQSSGVRTEMGIELDGQLIREYPATRRMPLSLFEQ